MITSNTNLAAGPIPEVRLPEAVSSKFERERRAFFRLLPQLMAQHKGQFVAIHEEQIAGLGPDRLPLAMEVLNRVGNVDIFVGLVSDVVQPPARSGVRRVAEAGSCP